MKQLDTNIEQMKKEIELSKKQIKKANRKLKFAYWALQGMCIVYFGAIVLAVILEVCQ